jgi:hypothetical protein
MVEAKEKSVSTLGRREYIVSVTPNSYPVAIVGVDMACPTASFVLPLRGTASFAFGGPPAAAAVLKLSVAT